MDLHRDIADDRMQSVPNVEVRCLDGGLGCGHVSANARADAAIPDGHEDVAEW